MKKLTMAIAVIGCIVVGSYLFIRFSLRTKEIKPEPSKEKTIIGKALDLEPSLKAKLQELVKNGSDGLYSLQSDSIISDVLQSKITLVNASLIPDFNVLKKLDAAHKAPDDVFKITLHDLHIDGLGLKDILSKKNIDLKDIYIDHPVIEIYHQKRVRKENDKEDNLTVYQKIKEQLQHFAANKISITNGEITIIYPGQKNKHTKIEHVNVDMADILIDSTTQYDKDRFLFAKSASILLKDNEFSSVNDRYQYKLATVAIDAVHHSLVAKDVSLQPVGGKEGFLKKLKYDKEMYNTKVSEIKCTGIQWWDLLNNEQLIADNISFTHPDAYIYLDLSFPPPPNPEMQTFPDQLLLGMSMQIKVNTVNIINGALTYEEFHPKVRQSGTISFDKINGLMTNVTNMPQQIKTNKYSDFSGSANFMKTTPLNAKFRFDLANYKTGKFSADVSMGYLDNSVINTFSAPLGAFILKRGAMKQASAHVEGDNNRAKGTLSLLYNDLHITPLKDTLNNEGEQKKKPVTSFLGNILLIKNDNPTNNEEPRTAEGSYNRKPDTSFFNLIFKTVLSGALKIIGLPQKLANPSSH